MNQFTPHFDIFSVGTGVFPWICKLAFGPCHFHFDPLGFKLLHVQDYVCCQWAWSFHGFL